MRRPSNLVMQRLDVHGGLVARVAVWAKVVDR